MDDNRSVRYSIVIPELYFLISKFLSAGPLQETAEVLIKELEQKKVLPKRIDWQGVEHDQSFIELDRKYPHIGPLHLIEICSRIGPILDKELIPSVAGVVSLLGNGRQSLLRTKDSICRPRSLLDYYTRLHGMPIPDSANCKPTHNILKVLFGRETAGPIKRKLFVPTSFYSKTRLLRRTLGHLSAVYCVLFDRSGRYIITGADDLLVKLWSAVDGRLFATFRGASAEITDIAINLDNTLLAAGSLDRILRVWDLQTTAPIAVLPGHTGMITSVNFCPSPRGDLKYLVTTSTDGSVAFWQYTTPRGAKTVFALKPIQYHEKLRPGQAQMICAAFSPGGIFLAAGSADHHVRVYIMHEDGPKRILETESHTDAVDSIQWAHRGLKFVSGSKDGTAHVWTFESQQWKSLKLNMSDNLASCPTPLDDGKKLKVTMVSWDYSDKWVITAVNDCTIKIWESKTGRLHKVLRGHKDELYVLESHPKDEHVLLSAGHDGQLFLWDIEAGIPVGHFVNNIDGQGHGGVFDAKWSPDGTMIAATDSHGHILMFGFGSGHERFSLLPRELFFHTDYRPLLRDANHLVMDEQTQMMPHLMPPPFLVDVDGNPHPPVFQRLVPGREDCPSDQLVPNIAVGPEGVEVIDNANLSHIDRLIAALANRQGQEQAPDSNNERENMNPNMRPIYSPRSNSISNNNNANGHRVGLRRTGDVEGVRQSSGNWQRETSYKWIRRIYVRPMKYAHLQSLKQVVYAAGQHEQELYRREMRRRPIMINTANANTALQNSSNRSRGGRNVRRGPRPAYQTRAVREREPVIVEEMNEDEEEEDDDDSASNSSGDSSFSTAVNEEELSGSSTSDTESSDYSDWVADKPGPNLEPPKRSKRKPVERRTFSPSSDSQQGSGGPSRKKKISVPAENGEIPEAFRPPEWLSEVIPRKAPYYPQMGDEVVYFRQGHQRYLEAVRAKKVYKLTNSSEPWNSLELRDHELVRVIGIKYEIRPPRLCCLKLALINRDGQMTGRTFTIKYHDMPDVLDFLVLRQTFDSAVERNWDQADRFRCMIDDGWWMGQIESRNALSQEFPDSLFMCFRVRWDNGEYEYMSPWDMEPIDENRLPAEIGGAVHVLPEELRATLYQPKSEEWPRGDRDASCRRIISGLEQVMGLAIADPFLAPVDLNIYPAYAFLVEYPIDLTTIKARFENHFYRRITSAQFDVRYLATNAEKFNQTHSNIVKHARIVTDLCLRIIRDPNEVDVGPVYHQLVATYISSDSENENDNEPVPSTSTAATTSAKKKAGARRSKRLHSETDWRQDCRELLDLMWQCDDSTPFREPVDTLEHPDYLQIVDTPMDLRTIKEDLLGGNYALPLEFAKDMRLIFQNSRNYNTNKRSRIYSMTLRLSTLFETHIKQVLYNWKAARRRVAKAKGTKVTPPDRNRPGPSKMSTRATTSNGGGLSRVRPNHHNSSDEDDDDDDNGSDDGNHRRARANAPRNGGGNHTSNINNNSNMTRPTRNGRTPRKITPSSTNGVSSTISTAETSAVAGESTLAPSGRGVRRNASSRPHSQEEENDNDDETASTTSSSSSSSSSSNSSSWDDSEESHGIPLSELGVHKNLKGKMRGHRNGGGNSGAAGGHDSEDSYKPNDRSNKRNLAVRKRKRINRDHKTNGRKPKRSRVLHSDNDNDDDDQDNNHKRKESRTNSNNNSNNTTNRKRRKYRKKNLSSDESDQEQEQDHDSEHHEGHTDEENHNDGRSSDKSNYIDDKPKKRRRGRPPKSHHRNTKKMRRTRQNTEEDSNEQLNLNENSNSRSSRSNTNNSNNHNTNASNRNLRHQSEHSYHLTSSQRAPMTSTNATRILHESDTEHEIIAARPTRSSVRRLNWRRDDDSLDEDHDVNVEIRKAARKQPLRLRGKKTSESEYSQEDSINNPTASSAPSAGNRRNPTSTQFRQVRTNRNSSILPEEDETEEDETIAAINERQQQQSTNNTSSSRTRPSRNLGDFRMQNGGSASLGRLIREQQQYSNSTSNNNANVISRRVTAPSTITASATITRSHANSTTNDTMPTSSSSTSLRSNTFRSHVQVDHDYGEPGPSTMRHTRRMLSRHQRNADELDPLCDEVDPLELPTQPSVVESISSRLRMRNNVNSTTNRNPIEIFERPIRRVRNNLPRYISDNDEGDVNDRVMENDLEDEQQQQSQNHHEIHEENPHDDHDNTDSEDNQPLTFMAGASTSRKRKALLLQQQQSQQGINTGSTGNGASGSGTSARLSRNKRYLSDDDDNDNYDNNNDRVVDDEDEDDDHSQSRGSRSTRNQKRPHYNEDTDEDDDDYSLGALQANRRKRRTGMRSSPSSPYRHRYNTNHNNNSSNNTRNSNIVNHNNNDDNLESDEQTISISSRGRVRKITAKARGLFRD